MKFLFKKNMITILIVLIGLCLPILTWADNNYGSGEYLLRQGAGTRAGGMAGAFVAVANDATAGYWNPAGLAQMEMDIYQAAMQYAYLPNDMSVIWIIKIK